MTSTLKDGSEYPLTPLSHLTYKLRGTGEIFQHPTGFSAGWNGASDSGRGMLLNLGNLALEPPETHLFDDELEACYLGVMPPVVGKSDYHDTKRDTTGTGGGERRYVDAMFARAVHLKEQNAFYALMSWNLDQLNRPLSRVPWEYDESGRWAGQSHGHELRGWNAIDPAHASHTADCMVALIGHPLGLMNFWLKLRFLFNDSFRGNPLDQPRCAWLLRWARWALDLKMQDMAPELLQAFFRFPKSDPAKPEGGFDADLPTNPIEAWSEWLVRSWTQQYDRNYPDPKPPGKTDQKVLPQVKGTPFFAGYYTWQYGLAMFCFHRHGDSRLSILADKPARVLSDYFHGDGVTWPYSRGTDRFDTEAELLALMSLANEPQLATRELGDGWHVVKSWKSYGDELTALIAPGMLMELGPSHVIVQSIVQNRKRTLHWEYMAPFWKAVQ